MEMSEELSKEYDATFDDEQKVTNVMKLDSNSFHIFPAVVEFDSLVIPEAISKSRKETVQGLTTMVGELGILYPIHVMYTESYKEWLESGHTANEDYDGAKYILLDGFRRVYAGYRNKLTRCNAVVWDFKDGEKGNEIFLILSRVLNRQQSHSWEEVWLLYNTLMSQTTLTDGTADYLLQLNMGDTSKLKAIMDGKSMFTEPYEDLISNKKTLQQAYNMLEKMRREVDVLSHEDQQGISEIDTVDGVVESADKNVLSDSDVKEILEMDDNSNIELSDDEFGEIFSNGEADSQKVGDRHPLDPALRAAVLARDGYKCVVTGRGEGLPTPIALSILNVHHIIPVHAGGKDSMDNLITVSLDVHTLIHIIERNDGKIGMSKEQYESLNDEEKKFILGTMKIARKAVEANRRLGRNKKEIYKDTESSVRFKMPGVVQKENMSAVSGN